MLGLPPNAKQSSGVEEPPSLAESSSSQRVCRGGCQPLPNVDPGLERATVRDPRGDSWGTAARRRGEGSSHRAAPKDEQSKPRSSPQLPRGSPWAGSARAPRTLRGPLAAQGCPWACWCPASRLWPRLPGSRENSPQSQGQQVAKQQRGDEEQQQLRTEKPLLPPHCTSLQAPPHWLGGAHKGKVPGKRARLLGAQGRGQSTAGGWGWQDRQHREGQQDVLGEHGPYFGDRCRGRWAQAQPRDAGRRRPLRSASSGRSCWQEAQGK